jgi:hypothetical protein
MVTIPSRTVHPSLFFRQEAGTSGRSGTGSGSLRVSLLRFLRSAGRNPSFFTEAKVVFSGEDDWTDFGRMSFVRIEIPTAYSPYLLQLLCGRDLPLDTLVYFVVIESS